LFAVALLAAGLVPNTGCKLLQILSSLLGGAGGGLPPIGGGGGTIGGGLPPVGGGGGFPPAGGGGGFPPAGGGSLPGGGSAMPPTIGGPGQADIRPPGNLAADDYDYTKDIRYVQVPTNAWNGNDEGSAHARDVMTHDREGFTAQHGLSTMVHETVHGINNKIAQMSSRLLGMYIEDGKGVQVQDPGFHRREIAPFIPQTAKSVDRFNTYITGIANQPEQVLYIWDEWAAYISGARAGVEQAEAGRFREYGQDMVDGPMDLLYFSTSSLQAIKQRTPAFMDPANPQGKQLKAAFALQSERTMKWVGRGLKIRAFSGFHAQQLFNDFQSGAGNQANRELLKQWLGPGFTKRVFGF
jgi:hypothetical protein